MRGAIALTLTIGGMALLLSFRTPDAPAAGPVLALADQPAATEELVATPPPTAVPATAVPATDVPPTAVPPTPTSQPVPASVTLVGAPVSFRYGNVQVAVTLEGEDIVDVEALAVPQGDRRSASISRQVEPYLRQQAISRDSAAVDVISGATYTSKAYAMSLQSALDQAQA